MEEEEIDVKAWRGLVDELAPVNGKVMRVTRFEMLAFLNEIERLRATLAIIANGRNTVAEAPYLAEAELRRSFGQQRGGTDAKFDQGLGNFTKYTKE